jgi:hypothetical protein
MDARVEAVITIMRAGKADHVGVRFLSGCVNLSPARLRQLFKKRDWLVADGVPQGSAHATGGTFAEKYLPNNKGGRVSRWGGRYQSLCSTIQEEIRCNTQSISGST